MLRVANVCQFSLPSSQSHTSNNKSPAHLKGWVVAGLHSLLNQLQLAVRIVAGFRDDPRNKSSDM